MGLLARNYSWIGLLSGKSLFSFSFPLLKASSILYTEKAVVGVMVYIFIPFVFYALTYGLLSVKEEHIEAGRILGANIFQIIIYIVLPLSQRAALLAGFFVFISSVGYFVTPFMLGGGKYDFVGNLILAISNYGLFDEASKFAIAFFIILIPFYVLFMYFIIRRKEEILGK
jgi:spermidine/putrescine transport system permease protein